METIRLYNSYHVLLDKYSMGICKAELKSMDYSCTHDDRPMLYPEPTASYVTLNRFVGFDYSSKLIEDVCHHDLLVHVS